MNKTKKVFDEYINSEIGKSLQTITAFTIRRTPTKKDDQILDNIADIKDDISDVVDNVAAKNPTIKELKKAAYVLLKALADMTKSKWLKFVVALVSRFLK